MQVVGLLCELPFKGITRERILLALAHKGYKKKGEFEHELRVVYELVQGNKLHKERLKVRCLLWRDFLLRLLLQVSFCWLPWLLSLFAAAVCRVCST